MKSNWLFGNFKCNNNRLEKTTIWLEPPPLPQGKKIETKNNHNDAIKSSLSVSHSFFA